MFRAASYGYPRPSGSYFCLNVPPQIRKKAHQIRNPLATRLRSVAVHRASYIAFRCRGFFNLVRSGAMPEIRDFDLKLLVERWLRELLSESEHHRWEMSPHSEAGRQEVLRELSYWETTYREALGRGDLEMTKEQAALLLREKAVQIASDAPEVRVVARELLKASIAAVKEEQRRFRGEFDEATILPSRVSSAGSVIPVKNATAIPEPIPLSKAFDGFEAEMVAGEQWTEKTRSENRAMFEALVKILGDRSVGAMLANSLRRSVLPWMADP